MGYTAAMDKWKSTSSVLLGMVLGLGWAVACGEGDDGRGTPGAVTIPGVPAAMAQSGCAQWEASSFDADFVGEGEVYNSVTLPVGYTPLAADGDKAWGVRCAQ